jgi:hypothetical protein
VSPEAKTIEPLSTRRELELLRDLQRLANERAREEQRIATALADGLAEAEKSRDAAVMDVERKFTEGRTAAATEFERANSVAREQYEAERNAAQEAYKGLRQGVESELSRVKEEAHNERQNASWEALTVFDAVKGKPREKFEATVARLKRNNQELAVLEHDAAEILKMRRQWREFPPVEPSPQALQLSENGEHAASGRNESVETKAAAVPANAQRGWRSLPERAAPQQDAGGRNGSEDLERTIQRAAALTTEVRQAATALHRQKLSKLFEGGMPFGAFFTIWALAAITCALVLGWTNWLWAPISVAIAATVFAGMWFWLRPLARAQSGEQFQAILQLVADARENLKVALSAARERAEREAHALVAERDQHLNSVEERVHALVGERERWKEGEIGRAGQTFPQRLAELRSGLDQRLADARKKHATSLALVTESRDQREAQIRHDYGQRVRELRAEHDRGWESLVERWRSGLAALNDSWDQIQIQCIRLFPDWNTTEYGSWSAPTEAAPAIQFGHVKLKLSQIKNGVPHDERLKPTRSKLEIPAMMTLEEHPVMLITAEEEGRREAVDVLQMMMLRMLTAMPPGKVRFTILDPVGLGENFASFMHLADFDEQLIASRIWTESRQIDEQLTRLTAHMETVLQKYLRNEFATIHEYNAQAGEVAEPFQLLVVANFPTNFSEAAARKLVSIATSGPRCGVYTLIMVDRKQKMPANFDLKDLEVGAVHLDWVPKNDGLRPLGSLDEFELPTVEPERPLSSGSPERPGFHWRYPAFEQFPLALDKPPVADRFNDVVRAAGRAAKDSMRVEVPFEQVAPPASEYWAGDSGKEFVVPIGRAGARRLQPVRLGKGTSQHLLVAGKTGSGKSTFLHGLITNAALIYSPEQVEFYLIDFKKGVEFKTYATHHLPHARVIAIESEREFGLSVLERLDGELRRRGELFRAAGVQDLPDFRKARPEMPMPRVLFVVDEFQELFVEDDKLAQDAGLLLDRLVRQGRAFGIHVLLGSQTLSGAYSLARSTMGQMAVRVALQCSETDAHLILSDERNEAARFLSRPGEAIYNDQNGLLAGNHPFQVVWLPESQRINYLRQVEAKSRESGAVPKETIVFEGDQAADPAKNLQLREIFVADPASVSGVQKAWIGAAVAIKEPTYASFGRHAGSNLLVVGAWDESALGVLANAVIALAAQNRRTDEENERAGASSPPRIESPVGAEDGPARLASIYVLDGTRPESPEAGAWQRIAASLPSGVVEVAEQRDTARVIGTIADELKRREAANDETAPPIYLVIFNGGRFRDLRRGDDDFSFSMDRDKPPSPDKQWAEMLKNGPAWGIHSLVWCDSYNNVNRLLDRMAMREFEMRVAFQMSAADSSSLLDNPAAAKLRQHRGLFASEDLGTIEKFRPYGVPTDEWLHEVRSALRRNV